MPRDFSEASDTITAPRAGAMSNATRASGTAPKGRLCKVEDVTGTKEYEYDLLGRVTDVTETRGALTFTLGYSYDLAGNVTGITLPSGRTVTYTLNGNGQVSGVSADVNSTPTALASSITYLPFGPMDALTYGNSLTFSATFDQDYYPTNRTVSGGIYNHTYDTDANGNIIQIGGTDFDYDELNRLDDEDSGSAVTYTYDATSNRLTKNNGGTTTTTVPAASNKISAVGGDSYTYDSAGNITDDDTYEYTWDAANRLEEIELSGTSTNVGSYGYNHASQRTTKTVSSVTTHYVYGTDGLLYGEYDSSGDLIREYVYLNGAPLAQIDDGSPEVLTYLHTDHLGTPRYGTNTGGTQVWAWAGDAFGVGAPTGSVTVNLRMPGQYFDTESELFYNWNRYYNPAIGRYISSDPIGLDGGINTFGYAGQNPVNFSDPLGLMYGMSFPEGHNSTPNPLLQLCLLEGGRANGGGNLDACRQAFGVCKTTAEQIHDRGYIKESFELYQNCHVATNACDIMGKQFQSDPRAFDAGVSFPPFEYLNGGGFVHYTIGQPPRYYGRSIDPLKYFPQK